MVTAKRLFSPKIFFLTATLVFLFDQGSKYLVRRFFSYTTNTGAAFGILQGYQWLLICITFVVIGILLYYRHDYPFPLGLILGGAVGNLVDRLVHGAVTDFIALWFWPSWPSFNVADSANTIGVLLLCLIFLREKK